LWKLSQIESKHTQVDLKSLVSPSSHTLRIRMRCHIWPMGAQRIRSFFGSSHNWFCAVVVRSMGCVRSLAHLPYMLFKTNTHLEWCTFRLQFVKGLGNWPATRRCCVVSTEHPQRPCARVEHHRRTRGGESQVPTQSPGHSATSSLSSRHDCNSEE
jgi:hypothetical protein